MSTPPTIHLTVDFPHGVLPEVFGVISAADPRELRGASALPGSILTNALVVKG